MSSPGYGQVSQQLGMMDAVAEEVRKLRVELGALKQCLAAAGIVTPAELAAELEGRRGAKQECRGFRCGPKASIVDIIGVSSACRGSCAWAGADAVRQLCQASTGVRNAVEEASARLYICGGVTDGYQFLNSWARLDLAARTWEQFPQRPMPMRRVGAAAATLNGQLHVCGGLGELGAAVMRLDAGSNRWKLCPSMAQPRFLPACAVLRGRLYVLGGSDADLSSTASVERLDPTAGPRGAWELLPCLMAQARQCALAAALAGGVYVCGGAVHHAGAYEKHLPSMERFDPDALAWTAAPPMSRPRASHCGAALGGRLYVCGGVSNGTILHSAVRFDAASGLWEDLPGMGSPRFQAAAVACAGRLYVMGGATEMPWPDPNIADEFRLDTAEFFDPARGLWDAAPRIPHRSYCCSAGSVAA